MYGSLDFVKNFLKCCGGNTVLSLLTSVNTGAQRGRGSPDLAPGLSRTQILLLANLIRCPYSKQVAKRAEDVWSLL